MASFLISDVRIFDGEKTIDSGSVLVENGKISKVSSSAIPFSGTKICKPGHTLLPGLIDVHIHANAGNEIALPQSLRCGVTTVCDLHNEWYNIQKLRKQLEGGDCADLKTTSFAATIEDGWPIPVVTAHDKSEETMAEIATWPHLKTPEDGRQYVQDRVKEGVDYIKLMHESGTVMGQQFTMPSIELQRAVMDEAHKHDLRVVVHATCYQDTLDILEAGVDGLTHCFVDKQVDDKLIAAYKKNGAHLNPTLATMGSGTAEGKAVQERYAHDPRLKNLVSEDARERMCHCMGFMTAAGASQKNAFETVRKLKAEGVVILCGSDAAGPAIGTGYGVTMHQELSLFVDECGFTPEEALRSATSLPAKRFNFTDRGSIKEGLRADLLLVEGNPLEDISHTLDLRGVWTKGELCSTYKDIL